MRWLTDGYGSIDRITNIVNKREIFIIFMVNPDGGEYDLTGSPYRAWRKNRQPNAGSTAIGTYPALGQATPPGVGGRAPNE